MMKGFEVVAVEVDKIRWRRVMFIQERGLRPPTFRGQHDMPNTPVARHGSTRCETEALQTVDDPRRVRGVAVPVFGERSHRSTGMLIDGEERPRVVGRQAAASEASGAFRARAHEEVEHQGPHVPRQVRF